MLYPRIPNLVSIVITNYNNGSYIQECLDSIRKQTYNTYEIIIVDDASTDHSKQQILEWIEDHKPSEGCNALFLPRNVGFAGALTMGFFMAKGEFIAVQDSDDLSHPERLTRQVDYLRQHPHIDLVGTNYAIFKDRIPDHPKKETWIHYGPKIRETYAKGGHCVCHGTILFRAALFDILGGPTRRIKGAEDYEFIVKFLNHKSQIENLPEILYYYRLHPQQRSLQFYSKQRGE
ncbi:glycosyltransferase family 2 protein [Paenibacillus silviterrae]|uniref:glycosyltransferase family 2 protein n=1 Tax=Paenibacillus silviterrae TaxID=3242194 RepID=UPI002543487A|nr:glycosyltransferase family 2 protein [Paenibacillus chinjuensis]